MREGDYMNKIKAALNKKGGIFDLVLYIVVVLIIILIIGGIEHYGYEKGYHAALVDYNIEAE